MAPRPALLALVAVAAALLASPAAARFHAVRPLAEAPHLELLRRADASETVEHRVLLWQRPEGLEKLARVVDAVSTPGSAQYQQYLSAAQIQDMVSPEAAVQARVHRWLEARGAQSVEHRGDHIVVRAPAAAVEAMWSTELSWARGVRARGDHAGARLVATSGGFTVPAELEDAVETVTGFSSTVRRRRFGASAEEPLPSDYYVVPQTLAAQYNFEGLSADGTSQQVIEFVEDGFSQKDMATYCKGFEISPVPQVATRGDVKGEGDGEGVLDIDLIAATGQGANSTYWAIGNGWIIDFAQDLLNTQNPPLVNSISWGADERGEEDHARTEVALQKLAARGVTVLVASGDNGAVGTGQCSGNENVFEPSFPATSQYVLSVGATQLQSANGTVKLDVCTKNYYPGCAASGVEAPANQPDGNQGDGFSTGGGFSIFSPQPEWQSAAVGSYLSSVSDLPPRSAYNSSNRGYPDVAAFGWQMAIYGKGVGGWTAEGGTSASTPVFGGIVSLINAHLASAGKRPVGLVNALLYKMASEAPGTFLSIQPGNNKDGCQNGYVSNGGGWDPVTGLGPLNVKAAIQYVDSNLDMFADL